MSRPAKIFSRLFVFIRIISIIFGKPYFAFMYYLTTFMKINGVYGLEEEKRREEKRREEKRRGNLKHPSFRKSGRSSRFTTAIYNKNVSPACLQGRAASFRKGSSMMPYTLPAAYNHQFFLSKSDGSTSSSIFSISRHSFGIPSCIFSVPSSIFSVPRCSFSIPRRSFSVSSCIFSIPSYSFSASRRNFSVSSYSFSVSSYNFGISRHSFSIPSYSFSVSRRSFGVPRYCFSTFLFSDKLSIFKKINY